eukprot:Trichotokara_eunicae@DN6268_c1_g1_i8.p1
MNNKGMATPPFTHGGEGPDLASRVSSSVPPILPSADKVDYSETEDESLGTVIARASRGGRLQPLDDPIGALRNEFRETQWTLRAELAEDFRLQIVVSYS